MSERREFLRVALTGGIATGKSHCLARFAALGASIIDADTLAHEAIEPETPGFGAVLARFGEGVLGTDGRIDRARLGVVVFDDARARVDLEHIIHPVVYTAVAAWFERLRPSADRHEIRAAIADIPLLYETGRDRDFDRVIVAACRPDQQLARLVARDHLSEDEAKRRIATQISIADKARRADFLIDTSGAPADTDRRVAEVWTALTTG